MTKEEFNQNHRILFQTGIDESFVTVVNKGNNQLKKYTIPHEGKIIEVNSEDYFTMPSWIEEKVTHLIFNDFNVSNND